MFGIRTVTDGDIKTFQSRGFACTLLAEAAQAENGVCAYIEPTLVDAKALEAAVPANFTLITYEGENIGRQSFYGQGAGQMATAANVMQDCLSILEGRLGFYAPQAVPADVWDNGVVTGAVNTYEMLSWAKKQLAADPACFIAGIR